MRSRKWEKARLVITCILPAAEKKHDLSYASPKFLVNLFLIDLLFVNPRVANVTAWSFHLCYDRRMRYLAMWFLSRKTLLSFPNHNRNCVAETLVRNVFDSYKFLNLIKIFVGLHACGTWLDMFMATLLYKPGHFIHRSSLLSSSNVCLPFEVTPTWLEHSFKPWLNKDVPRLTFTIFFINKNKFQNQTCLLSDVHTCASPCDVSRYHSTLSEDTVLSWSFQLHSLSEMREHFQICVL